MSVSVSVSVLKNSQIGWVGVAASLLLSGSGLGVGLGRGGRLSAGLMEMETGTETVGGRVGSWETG